MFIHHRNAVFIIQLFAFLAGLVYLPATPLLHPIPDRDEGVFLYVAHQMFRHGAVPYRDVWDHKPPGAYLLPWLGS